MSEGLFAELEKRRKKPIVGELPEHSAVVKPLMKEDPVAINKPLVTAVAHKKVAKPERAQALG